MNDALNKEWLSKKIAHAKVMLSINPDDESFRYNLKVWKRMLDNLPRTNL